MSDILDVVIIGAGIAGASIGAGLSAGTNMIMLEAEDRPGYHTTGRSAAIYVPDQGPEPIRALTVASLDFFLNPPNGFVSRDILTPRGFVFVAEPGEEEAVKALIEDAPSLEYVNQERLYQLMPGLAKGRFIGGAYCEGVKDIDVDLLHQAYLAKFKANGGAVKCNSRVTAITKEDGIWCVKTKVANYYTQTLVNAAGAWGDIIGEMAGCAPMGLQPKKRTAAIVEFDRPGQQNWPVVSSVDDSWYFQPSGSNYFVSPADEQPSDPCDAWADDMDVAMVIDKISQAIGAESVKVENSWAGLRSFTPDGVITIGYDKDVEGFFWFIGQGGYGIESSPGASLLGVSLFEGKEIPQHLLDCGVDPSVYSPLRNQKA